MNPLTRPWRHLFDFSGRATRTEYGLYHITGFIALMIFWMIVGAGVALIGGPRVSEGQAGAGEMALVLLGMALYVVFLITHIAISVRRLHDHGEPGAKFLLTFIPLVGIIFWLMMVFTAGNAYENDYGPDPRQPEIPGNGELGGVFS